LTQDAYNRTFKVALRTSASAVVESHVKVLLSGATGLVGTALTTSLQFDGHTVTRLVRPHENANPGEIRWDPSSAMVDLATLESFDAVVNLAGASIGDGRWTDKRKQILRSSRIDTTRVLVDALSHLQRKPSVFISASAVGYYGNRGDTVLTESTPNGQDFLGLLARSWEAEAHRAERTGIRTVITRFGIILAKNGGSLPQMITPIKWGVGGRYGSGEQWISWIALEDVVRVIRLAIEDDTWKGPINVSAPEPLRNDEFVRVLAGVLHRPALLPAPAFVLRIVLGEMADALLLSSQRAQPEFLLKSGFNFRCENLEGALREILA
jgi:uncharacterized protein (TIGR01777 family)